MIKNKELWLSFTAGVLSAFAFHVIETSLAYPPLTDDMAVYCQQGNIHPDCNQTND
jgi:hypothetical protein